MRPLDSFWSILSNGYHGNDDRYKHFDFSSGYVFHSSMTTKFHHHQVAGEKISMIKIFKFFSDHLKATFHLTISMHGQREMSKI